MGSNLYVKKCVHFLPTIFKGTKSHSIDNLLNYMLHDMVYILTFQFTPDNPKQRAKHRKYVKNYSRLPYHLCQNSFENFQLFKSKLGHAVFLLECLKLISHILVFLCFSSKENGTRWRERSTSWSWLRAAQPSTSRQDLTMSTRWPSRLPTDGRYWQQRGFRAEYVISYSSVESRYFTAC